MLLKLLLVPVRLPVPRYQQLPTWHEVLSLFFQIQPRLARVDALGVTDLNRAQLQRSHFFVPRLIQMVIEHQKHPGFHLPALVEQLHPVSAAWLCDSSARAAIRKLHQKSVVIEITLQFLDQPVDVSEQVLDAGLDSHVFQECVTGSDRGPHRVHRYRVRYIVRSSMMVIFQTPDTWEGIYPRNFQPRHQHRCHLLSIHNLGGQVVSCR